MGGGEEVSDSLEYNGKNKREPLFCFYMAITTRFFSLVKNE